MRILVPGIFLFIVYALLARWFYFCEIRQQCGEPPVVEAPRLATLALTEGDSVILQGYDQFLFREDSLSPVLNQNNQQFLEAVAYFLEKNTDKRLTIEGRYLASERDAPSGFFENIGIGRAAQAELLLEAFGVDASRIFLDHASAAGDTLFEPLAFSVSLPDSSEFQQLQFTFRDMTYSDANFEYNSDVFTPGPAFLSYADSARTFLLENPDFRMLITGHTDSIASETYNEDLGLRRAKSAQAFFQDMGVTNEINVLSRGESEPVAPNSLPDGTDNPEGRQKNRRVNFKLESTLENPEG